MYKALAVAAFSLAVGEFLARWRDTLGCIGWSLLEWVPYVECGNEMEDLMGSFEGGRLMALLAGPIHAAVPETRFRVGELASWAADTWEIKLAWLRDLLERQIQIEVERWRTPEPLWEVACEAAGFCWPPSGGEDIPEAASDLFRQVGFHWFHANEPKSATGIPSYQGEARLVEDIQGLKGLLEDAGEWGYTLTWSVGATGFNAEPNPSGETPFNSNATPMFQAGELVRILLTLLANGAERACWHAYMSNIVLEPDILFSAMGLRNDVGDPFTQALDAWRRPSWLALRRLVELLSLADSVEVVQQASDRTVLRLSSSRGFHAGGVVHAYAWVAWLDQESTEETCEFTLWDPGRTGFSRVQLVPSVTASTVDPPPVDENGFCAGETIDWEWAGADDYAISTRYTGPVTGDEITVELRRLHADPSRPAEPGFPAPVCILTSAEEPWDTSAMVSVVEEKDPVDAEAAGARYELMELLLAEVGAILSEIETLVGGGHKLARLPYLMETLTRTGATPRAMVEWPG